MSSIFPNFFCFLILFKLYTKYAILIQVNINIWYLFFHASFLCFSSSQTFFKNIFKKVCFSNPALSGLPVPQAFPFLFLQKCFADISLPSTQSILSCHKRIRRHQASSFLSYPNNSRTIFLSKTTLFT